MLDPTSFASTELGAQRILYLVHHLAHPAIPDEKFAPFPTYPVVLFLKGDDQDVNLFGERVRGRAVPGLPKFNPNRVVRPDASS